MRVSLFASVVLITLAISATTSAGQLSTAPAQANFGGQAMYCDIVNMGNQTATVTVEAKNYLGVVTTSQTTTLPPGTALSLLESGTGAYCVFTVSGSAKKFRAAAIYYNAGLYTMAMEAH